MSEDRFENVMRELREAAPPAPEELRQRVRALREPRAKAQSGGFGRGSSRQLRLH